MRERRGTKGFTLIEAVLVMAVIGFSFIGFGLLFGNISQEALKSDLTILATKLAREKLDEVIQVKADSGYAAVVTQAPASVSSGDWAFTRQVDVSYLNPADFSTSLSDTGYKKIEVTVQWGATSDKRVTLTTLVTNHL